MHRTAWKAGVLGAVNVLTQLLAVRLIVLIAVVGWIVLSFPALTQPDWYRLGILSVYCVGVVFPAVLLAALGR